MMAVKFIVFLILVCYGILLTLLPVCEATSLGCVYYVVPSSHQSQDCPPGEPCYTLEQYATNVSLLFCKKADRNISLLFLDGTHNLRHSLVINKYLSLSMYKAVVDSPGVVTIEVHNKAEIILSAQNVSVEQLNITSNGSVGLSIDLRTESQAIISVSNMTYYSSTLFIRGLLSTVTVKHCKFILEPSFPIPPIEMMFLQQIYIFDVVITSESNLLSTHPSQPEKYSDVVVYLTYPDASINLSLVNSTFNRTSETGIFVCSSTPGYDLPATGYNLYMAILDTVVSRHWNGAIVFDMSFRMPEFVNIHVYLTNASIVGNHITVCSGLVNGAGVTFYSRVDPYFSFNTSEITFFRSEVSYNTNLCSNGVIISTNSLVPNMTVVDSTFQGNVGTPILVSDANVFFQGKLTFSDNIAHQGGALVLNSAFIYLVGCVHVVFDNNSALEVGGAIFIEAPSIEFENIFTDRKCFYQYLAIESPQYPCFKLSFSNNKAEHGGEHIYGALMQSNCIVYAPLGTNFPSGKVLIVHGYDVYNTQPLFDYKPNLTNSLSPISSNPLRVCLCDANENHTVPINIQCTSISDIFLSRDIFPGEMFHISTTIIGADFGTTTGSVYAQFLEHHTSHAPVLGSFYQYSQRVLNYSECTLLTYAINSSNENEVLVLTATDKRVQVYGDKSDLKNDNQRSDSFKLQFTTPVYVNISLHQCPLGFTLSKATMGCQCDLVLEKNDIMCNISNGIGYIYRTGVYWINGTINENNETNIIVHKYCPYNYCKTQELAVDLRYPDTQCAFHHAGVLCGGCEQNYSLTLGNNKCLVCPDESHLGLLILFMALGIILVFFIQSLDLTVKQGTINGLIFYANIVWAYQNIFLPDLSTSGIQTVLQTFVAWMNLDFGIETCFFRGLDAYWKTWLQFVFPLYIWSIAGLMIKLSACSESIAKVFGKNSVHVLATLVLLSYNKLLRTCITALDLTYLINSAMDTKLAVWSFDGNLDYCRFPHILLFVAAIAVLLILWLPFTLVLSLVQWLRNEKISRYRILRWIDNIKLKPFFDAYLAPLKDNHRYWVGLLLAVRGLLMVTFALTSANTPTVNLLTVGLLTALLLLHQGYNGRVYKSKCLSLLENSFFCNLAVLSIVILYLDDDYHYYPTVFYCSVGVAFCQFICIVLFHICTRIVTIICSKNPQRDEYANLDDSMFDHDGRDR